VSLDADQRISRLMQKAARANATWYRLAKATKRLLSAHDGPPPDRRQLHPADLLEARTALAEALALLHACGRD
jgi:hypothetical protein